MMVDHCFQLCDDGPLRTIPVILLYPDCEMTRNLSHHRDGSIRSCDVQNCRDDPLSSIRTKMIVRIDRLCLVKNDIIIYETINTIDELINTIVCHFERNGVESRNLLSITIKDLLITLTLHSQLRR
jgi:hypothetical protein